jgi:beta-mannosidase
MFLSTGAWQLAETAPGVAKSPADLPASLEWLDAVVPGTVAASLARAGRWSLDRPRDLDAVDFWYRARFAAEPGGTATLSFDGLASIADVFVNGVKVLSAVNALRRHDVTVRALAADNELVVRFASLNEALRARRPRPRWKTRLVAQQQLRWHRTPLLGRIAGWTPPVTPVGPFRPISIDPGEPAPVVRVRSSVVGRDGVVSVRVDGALRSGTVSLGDRRVELDPTTGTAELRVPDVALWWPHTHGAQPLHDVDVEVVTEDGRNHLVRRRTGFRSLVASTENDGFSLIVNGVPVFCRGACWMPTDPTGLSSTENRRALEQMRDAGMNVVRCTGTMPYEDDAFFAAADELGLLVWQDFAFANLDYPADDEAFSREVELEANDLASRTAHCPSMAVFCGGSEVEQQAAMVGMPREAWSNRLFDSVLPSAVATLAPGAVYVKNSPTGGPLPFTVDRGISHYYGVGAYLRPLEDARHAGVRFTSECLGFSNVPSTRTCDLVLGDVAAPQHPAWKARVPRDGGVGWDFEDVRDHYLALLYRVDPTKLRYADWERYLALSREVTGDVMARTVREFRRGASPCQGAIVWFFRDLWPGAGWGVVDALGRPKAAWFHLKRAQASVALSLSDEGLNGLRVHAWNDHETPVSARLRVALYQDGEVETIARDMAVTVAGRGETVVDVDGLFGSFTDSTYAYRFGPPAHDLAIATLVGDDGAVLAEACLFPHGPPTERASDLGLVARAGGDEGGLFVELETRRVAWGVSLDVEGLSPEDDHLTLGPGRVRRVRLRGAATAVRGAVTALNGRAPVRITSA